jgi:hypothetical protein
MDGLPVLVIASDLNGDGKVDLLTVNGFDDVSVLLSHLFLSSPLSLPCEGGSAESPGPGELRVLDANGDQAIDISDTVWVLGFLFRAGEPHVLGTICVPIEGCPDTCR